MLTEKDKLTVMQSNLAAIEMLAQKVIEQVRHAAEPAPEDNDDSRRYTHLVGGLGNLSDLTANLNSLAQATDAIYKLKELSIFSGASAPEPAGRIKFLLQNNV